MLEYKDALEKYFDEHMQEILKSLGEIIAIQSVGTLDSDIKPFGEGSARALRWGEDFLKSLGMKTLNTTSDDFKAAVDDLQSQGVKALVIDMRSNPGGFVKAATSMAEAR